MWATTCASCLAGITSISAAAISGSGRTRSAHSAWGPSMRRDARMPKSSNSLLCGWMTRLARPPNQSTSSPTQPSESAASPTRHPYARALERLLRHHLEYCALLRHHLEYWQANRSEARAVGIADWLSPPKACYHDPRTPCRQVCPPRSRAHRLRRHRQSTVVLSSSALDSMEKVDPCKPPLKFGVRCSSC